MKHVKLFESWLNKGSGVVPKPKKIPPYEVAEGSVTLQTMKLLKELESEFHFVSIFSYHPEIEFAQYSERKSSGGKCNSNSRSWVSNSLIVKKNKAGDSLDCYRFIEKALKNFPCEVGGGSGQTEKDGVKSYQAQISFLTKSVGTHAEARKIKEETFTEGAYKFENGKWLYIPLEKMNPHPDENDSKLKVISLIDRIFNGLPTVKDTKINILHFSDNPILTVYLEDKAPWNAIEITPLHIEGSTDYDREYDVLILTSKKPDFNPNIMENPVGLYDLLKVTKFATDLTDDEMTAISKNPENHAKILHRYRGRKGAKKFGF